MKAIVVKEFGDPEVLKLEEVPAPELKENQVLVDVKAIGVNPLETYLRAGAYPVLPELPYIPGKDAAGIISKAGAAVSQFKVGDRVYCSFSDSGSYAEKSLYQEQHVHALPENVSFDEGAAIGVPGATAWRALMIRGRAKNGEVVLLHGASGSVGLNAIQIARGLGLTVLGTAGTDEGMLLVKKMGADQVFNHKSPDYFDKLKASLNGKGPNLIIEMLANVNLANDLDLLAPKGRVIVVGNRGKIEIDPRATMGKETEIRGLSLFSGSPEEEAETHNNLTELMRTGKLKPVISHTLNLSDAPRAHEMVMQDGNCGKIILRT